MIPTSMITSDLKTRNGEVKISSQDEIRKIENAPSHSCVPKGSSIGIRSIAVDNGENRIKAFKTSNKKYTDKGMIGFTSN